MKTVKLGWALLLGKWIRRCPLFCHIRVEWGRRRLSFFFFFSWNLDYTFYYIKGNVVVLYLCFYLWRVFWVGDKMTLYFFVGQDLHKLLYPKRIWSYSSFLENVSYGTCGLIWILKEKWTGIFFCYYIDQLPKIFIVCLLD